MFLVGNRSQEGRGGRHTPRDWWMCPAEGGWRREDGRAGAVCLLSLTPAPLGSQGCLSMSIPGSLTGFLATLNTLCSHLRVPDGGPAPQLFFRGSSWEVRHPLAQWLAGQLSSGVQVGRTLEAVLGGNSVECRPPPNTHSGASLRGIIESISPTAHSALPLYEQWWQLS